MLPFSITICAEAEVCNLIDGHSHVVSITDPGSTAVIPGSVAEDRILRLQFHDIDGLPTDPGWLALLALGQRPVPPDDGHVRAILAFSDGLDRAQRVLIHCKAGVSRSTAAAAIIGCRRMPRREAEVFAYVRRIRPQALPNRLMIGIADRLLQAGGRMIACR